METTNSYVKEKDEYIKILAKIINNEIRIKELEQEIEKRIKASNELNK